MALMITDKMIRSNGTQHTAELVRAGASGAWRVSWLPGRVLTDSQATTAMMIAQAVGRIPAAAGPRGLQRQAAGPRGLLGGRTRPDRSTPGYGPSAPLGIAQPSIEVGCVHASCCHEVLDKGRHGREHVLPVAD
jgi:hypothetical protein